MNATGVAMPAINMAAQWITAAAAIWLTWWAAQSRDAAALRGVAMALVIVPALLWPFINFVIAMDTGGSLAGRAFLFAAVGAGIGLARVLFLVIWAIVSKDRPYLRVGGGVAAALLIVGPTMQFLAGPLLANFGR